VIPFLDVSSISDVYIRRNFEKILAFFNAESPLDGFRPLALSFTAPGTYLLKHGLGFTPKDVIQTSLIGAGTVVFNYSQFTATELSVTVGGAVTATSPTNARILVGTLGGLK
jgi:hypothetical protein